MSVSKTGNIVPPVTAVAPGPMASTTMGDGGINGAQWTVIGLLLLLLAAELMLHPTVRANVYGFLQKFAPPKVPQEVATGHRTGTSSATVQPPPQAGVML